MTGTRRELLQSLAIAGAMIGAALLLVGARRLGLVEDPSLGVRLFGVAMGLILAGYGNVIPKRLACFESLSDRPDRRQAMLRFSGWVFVIAGLANAAAWAFAPYRHAAWLSIVPIAAALLLVGTRLLAPRKGRQA